MSSLVGMLELAAVAALVFCAAVAAAIALGYPLARARLRRLHPASRARVLFAWLAAPAAGALLLTTVCFLPSAAALLGLGADHCLGHDDHHPHLCLVHRPAAPAATGVSFALALVATLLMVGLTREAIESARRRRLMRQLAAAGRQDRTSDVRWVETELPLAVADAGRRAVVLSSRLQRELPVDVVQVVVAHERAHVERRDARRLGLTRLLSVGHLPPVRRRLLADLALACEQACDELAAARIGDRLRVASAIVAVEQLFAGVTPSRRLLPAFADREVVARVEALLDDAPACRDGLLGLIALGTLGGALLIANPLHHLTESALALLAR